MQALWFWGTAFALCMSTGIALLGVWGIVPAIAVWLVVVAYTFKYFAIWSPVTHAIITIDALKKDENGNGKLRAYPSGLNFKHLSELPSGEHISLGFRTESFEAEFPTNDGEMAHMIGSYQWRPKNDPRHLERFLFIRGDLQNIQTGVKHEALGLLQTKTRQKSILQAENSREEFNDALDKHFNSVRDTNDTSARSIEEDFGIDVTTPTIATITGSEKWKESRSARRAMKEVQTAAHTMVKDAANKGQVLDYGAAMDAALLLQSSRFTKSSIKQSHRVEGSDLGEKLLSFLSMFANTGSKGAEPNRPKGGK